MLLSVRKTVTITWWKDLFNEFAKTLRMHMAFITIVSFYMCALVVTTSLLKVTDRISFSLYPQIIPLTVILFLISFFVCHSIYIMVIVRPKKLISYILHDLRTNYLTRARLLNSLPIILFMPLFMSTFTSFKTLIPILNPFSWDHSITKFESMIHGGFQAWQLCHPILGKPLLTSAINFFYNLWLFVMFAVLYWQAFSLFDSRLRMQFFLSFSLSWIILGTVIAILFSSAGPCYYDRVVERDNIYKPLIEYLIFVKNSYPVWALETQEMLWKAYKNSKITIGSGISAMPSMHVSMVCLFTLVGCRHNRQIGMMFVLYAIIIMFGSVHLGWHYAIDGYVAIFGTLLIWFCVGLFINKYFYLKSYISA